MRNVVSTAKASTRRSLFRALRRTARYHLRARFGMEIKPLKLRVKVTNRCNSRCIMCSVWKNQDNAAPSLPHELTVEEYRRLCEANREFLSKVERIALTGGEPTLRRDLVDIARVFTEAFPKAGLSINSNGFSERKTLETARQILQFRKKLTVMVSVDGIGEAHDATRGVRNVFPHVQSSIDGLLELKREHKGLKVEVNHVLTDRNADEMPRVAAFCRERGIYFNPICLVEGELYDNEGLGLAYAAPVRERLLKHVRHAMNEDNSLQLREVAEMLEQRPRDYDCWAGRVIMLLEDDGQVFPNGGCPKSFLLGNVREFDFDLRRLLDSKQARTALKRASHCRSCRLSCETMTTLQHPEALAGYRRSVNASDDSA